RQHVSDAFSFSRCAHPSYIHSFPTRRSSDLLDKMLSGWRPKAETTADEIAAVFLAIRRAIVAAPTLNHPNTSPRSPWRSRLEERSEEHTSELQSRVDLVCRLLLEKKKRKQTS